MHTLDIPNALSQYSLSETLTSGQTFRWLVAPPEETPETPLSNPPGNTFYLPTTTQNHDFVFKLTQNDDTIRWKTLGSSPPNTKALQSKLKKQLGFTYNYADAFETLKTVDPDLFNAISPSVSLIQDEPFETTISFICSPQATIDRIYQMQRNLEQEYGSPIQTEDGLFYTFPTQGQLNQATEEKLQDCNLGYRASYVFQTVRDLELGLITLPKQSSQLETQKLSTKLQECTGVGEKVADCILLYAYNRTEVIPVDTRIQQMVESRYDETATTVTQAKTVLENLWGTTHSGYYQLLLYDFAADELKTV